MKYLKKFNEAKGMGVLYELKSRIDITILYELLDNYFGDEIDYEISYGVHDTVSSDGIQHYLAFGYMTKYAADVLQENTFLIDFSPNSPNHLLNSITPVVGDIEKQIAPFNDHLKHWNLKVVYSDYGLAESNYELFIGDINLDFDPKMTS
jgi:hypothetical protein